MLIVKHTWRRPLRFDAVVELVSRSDDAVAGRAGAICELRSVGTELSTRFELGIGGATRPELDCAAHALATTLSARVDGYHLYLHAAPTTLAFAPTLVRLIAVHGWTFQGYATKARKSPTTLSVTAGSRALAKAIAEALAVGKAINHARELIFEPPNALTPRDFVARAAELNRLGIEQHALDEPAMRAAGMGALLSVAQGSINEPYMLVLKWNGDGAVDAPSIVLIGKGVCFDSGGLSLKSPTDMVRMKADMAGAAVVLAVLRAAAELQIPVNLIGVCGLVENMPDRRASRPGDVISSMSGHTIEILNTDSEGRLVLADCITWAQRNLKASCLIDIATLTGSVVTALGEAFAGIFSNDDNLTDQLRKSGERTGDRLWRLPLDDAFGHCIASPVADMKNWAGAKGGASIAAQFLAQFIEPGTSWAHLDISGPFWPSVSNSYSNMPTGYGVGLLCDFIKEASNRNSSRSLDSAALCGES